ncbi:tetratricopeptide repeat protein [Caballeronia sp. BR00000012568055]|uniref:tetratricopeptide repeat protein n=1 Tax=Caballeronia sp. BR00000012568055 TaxID=2918761 RepID=UPI0023F896A6|nr:tetratricopeptide repeat protein [Caballeronia sp. BR00000012568055]
MLIADEIERPLQKDFDSAMNVFRRGERARAGELCQDIINRDAAHAGANHLLGVIRMLEGHPIAAEALIRVSLSTAPSFEADTDLGLALKAQQRFAEAEVFYRRALSAAPHFAIAQSGLAAVLKEQHDVAGAEAEYRRAIELNPNNADFRFALGKLLSELERFPEAVEQLCRAVELRPQWADAHNSLGAALGGISLRDKAELAFRRALELNPHSAEAFCNLGLLLMELKRHPEAEAALRSALSLNGNFLGAVEGLAKLLTKTNRTEESISVFEKSLELKSNDVETLNSFGAALAEMKRFDEAERILHYVLELKPDFLPSLTNLGNVYMESGRLGQAEAPLRRALEIDPNYWGAVYNLSLHYKNIRRIDEAEAMSRRALELRPHLAACHIALGNALLAKCSGDISEALDCYRRGIELDPDCRIGHTNLCYTLTFVSEDGYDVVEECRRYAAHFEAPIAAQTVHHANERTAGRRLRIGYVSPDFREHCQALFMMPLLRNHDREAFEIYCYSTVGSPDQVTGQIEQMVDVLRNVHKLDDDQLALQITEDRIDVLVDLTMHMSANRLPVFARRPAPVQISWLAYPGTTGSTAIDYRLTDPWLDPEETGHLDDRYTETSIRLPDTFWCYDSRTTDVQVNELPAATLGHITFGCLNNPCKLTDHTFSLWAQVLRQVEGSRLKLLVAHGDARNDVSRKFAALGVDPERITFLDYQSRDAYLRTYNEIDMLLDTFPYNGHTTSLDALWMGVPVVTVIGKTPASRAGYSLLSNLGMQELAAESESEFVRTAVELARDLPRLTEIRQGLRERMVRSPLMDGARFARGMEAALRRVWVEWCGAQTEPV